MVGSTRVGASKYSRCGVFWSLPEHFFDVIVIGGDHAGVEAA
jgi:hypothetical protein